MICWMINTNVKPLTNTVITSRTVRGSGWSEHFTCETIFGLDSLSFDNNVLRSGRRSWSRSTISITSFQILSFTFRSSWKDSWVTARRPQHIGKDNDQKYGCNNWNSYCKSLRQEWDAVKCKFKIKIQIFCKPNVTFYVITFIGYPWRVRQNSQII